MEHNVTCVVKNITGLFVLHHLQLCMIRGTNDIFSRHKTVPLSQSVAFFVYFNMRIDWRKTKSFQTVTQLSHFFKQNFTRGRKTDTQHLHGRNSLYVLQNTLWRTAASSTIIHIHSSTCWVVTLQCQSSSELWDWCLLDPLKQSSAPVIRSYMSLMSSHSAAQWFVASYERDTNI